MKATILRTENLENHVIEDVVQINVTVTKSSEYSITGKQQGTSEGSLSSMFSMTVPMDTVRDIVLEMPEVKSDANN